MSPGEESVRKASILIVDDQPANLLILEKILKRKGYEVRPVSSGLLALETARANPPDLVLMDIVMPDMDGFETCAEFKQDPLLADIPVLFLSGLNETFDKIRAFSAGGIDYLSRPYEVEELQARMETHLKISRLQRELDRRNKNMHEKVVEQDLEIMKAHQATLLAKEDRTRKEEGGMNQALAGAQRRILITLRFLSLVIISSFLIFNPPPKADETAAVLLLALFLASILGMFFIYESWLKQKNFLGLVFALDTLFVTGGLYLTGVKEWDLMTLYFLTIFICALVKDVKNSVGVGVAACFIYLFLHYKITGQWLALDTATLLKLPFLLIVATFSGFLAADSRMREELARHYGKVNESISEQADRATQKLLASEKHLKELVRYHHLILANIQTGIVVAHQDGKVRTFNAAACKITGLVETAVVGWQLDELPANFRPVTQLMKRTLAEGKPFSQENVELDKQQPEPAYISLQTTLLQNAEGASLGVIATLKDVTLVKQMEQQLLRSERLANLGEMAAGVAHEIKNPLNAILGFSQRLHDKLEDAKLKQYALIVVEEVKRLASTVNDVLEYNRTQSVNKKLVNFNSVVDGTVMLVAEKADAAGVEIELEVDRTLPPVPMDEDKIRQVLLNLMQNALHAMEKGGTLTVMAKMEEGMLPVGEAVSQESNILQQVFHQQKMVSIAVKDTGCGIPKENIHKLFNPFFTTKTTGTGLGLSICHKVIESHGGFMRVDSQVGVGSSFIFYLPLEREGVPELVTV
jgi:PAS domain S-box-containing protein